MRSGKAALSHFLSQVLRSVAGFAATFVIARLLGAEGLGVYVTAVAVLFWLKLPTNSVSLAISKRVSEGTRRGGVLSAGFLINASYGILVGGMVLLFRDQLNAYIGTDVAVLVILLVVGNVLFDTAVGTLVGFKRVAVSGWLGTAERVARLLFQIALVLLGYGIVGLLLGHFLSLLLTTAIGIGSIWQRFRLPTKEDLRSITSFAQFSWLGSLKSNVMNWMDVTVLAAFSVGSGLIGIYEASWTLSAVLVLASNSIRRVLFPEFSALDVEGDYDRIHDSLNEALAFTGVFLIPGFFGALLMGERILSIYAQEFAIGANILVILIAAQSANAFGGQFVNVLNAIDRPDLAFRVNGVYIATNFVLNVGLVAGFGWHGAAVATGLSGVVLLLGGYHTLSKTIGSLDVPLRTLFAELLAAGVMTTGLWPILTVLPRDHYLTITVVFIGAGIYFVTLLSISSYVRRKVFSLIQSSVVSVLL